MIQVKVYKYDSSQEQNHYRGEDFSKYVLQASQNSEDITNVVDSSEITLVGLPIKEAFSPQTKFIIDIVESVGGEETIVETLDRCVSIDNPTQPIISDATYFDHHISFMEPSIIAQQRLVDNISTTYKLKDVTLEEVPTYGDEDVDFTNQASRFEPIRNFGHTRDVGFLTIARTDYCGKYFVFDGGFRMVNTNGVLSRRKYNDVANFAIDGGSVATFTLPRVAIFGGETDTKDFVFLGFASIDYKIEEFSLNDEATATNTWSGTIISNSDLRDSQFFKPVSIGDSIASEWLFEGYQGDNNNYFGFKKYTDTSAPTPSYTTIQIPISADMKYKVSVSIHEFSDDLGSGASVQKYSGASIRKSVYKYKKELGSTVLSDEVSYQDMTDIQTTASSTFITYSVESKKLVYASSTPYSALALLQKAIINSSVYEKKEGVYIADVNNSDLPFYIDNSFVDELARTKIIENFYNQKNLWEIMTECGNYIHAIPELVFGENDKFMITFSRLGRTDEKEDKGNKVSIFNSRNVEDYVCATSSYITNMVQLGGMISEWVAPKTTNEEMLVYNDTAEIVTSKPIIELLKVYVRKNQQEGGRWIIADATPYIYEQNVYKTLSVDYDALPNKGIAMYYSLGSNVITGGNYRLPMPNEGVYTQYAIKKIIYCAFNGYPNPAPTKGHVGGYWTDIDVKDYSFFVQYRTKDDVRQNHLRPDLRKYLLNSKWDKYPEHNQFNNQTDVVVDSAKFGSNMFGKLIKTGNLSYDIWEWHDTYNDVKHKGELYRINGELYYVSKVTHYFNSSYILSKISYSKDYNELSAIIGIPSEPRFYEISEQSEIRRDIAINEVFYLTDNDDDIDTSFDSKRMVFSYLQPQTLMFGTTDFSKYAITVFKGDNDNGKYDQTIGEKNTYIEVISPINAYSSGSTLTYEWDMVDNYSAGDKVINTEKEEYKSLRAVRYTDIYGKAPLMDFYILNYLTHSSIPDGISLSGETISNFPECPIKTKNDPNDTRPFVGDYGIAATNVREYDENFNGRGIGLLKDCREAISINFNLELINSSDTFVTSPFMFSPDKRDIKVVLLASEVNKLSNGYINNSDIITPIDVDGNEISQFFEITNSSNFETIDWGGSSKSISNKFWVDFNLVFAGRKNLSSVNENHFNGTEGFQRVKAIAIIYNAPLGGQSTSTDSIPYVTPFIIARNIPETWSKADAIKNWVFGYPKKDRVFRNKQ